jgi:hypothetical protein
VPHLLQSDEMFFFGPQISHISAKPKVVVKINRLCYTAISVGLAVHLYM